MLAAVISLGLSGLVFGGLLGFAAIKFAVPVDETAAAVREVLPGANCGGCGYAGCSALADAIAKGEAPVNKCPVGGADVAAKVAAIMGVEAPAGEREVARVRCWGGCERAADRFAYVGVQDCVAASMITGGGQKACSAGCLGFGTCVKACQFGAMSMGPDGLPVVDAEKCTACGRCVTACPKSLMFLAPASKTVHVRCNNKDKGPVVRKLCKVGCIACGACVRACPSGAITVENNLARIDHTKCTNCGACVIKCPVKVIEDEKGVPVVKADAAQEAQAVS
ncbi:MAG: RnfABCDGE type electron transport complex subunit B [Chloroflexota bacterium]